MLVNDYTFNKIKKEVDDSVVRGLGPKINKKKIACSHLKQFLQDILNGRFNNVEKAEEYYGENIYKKYEKKES